jgi:hypothetical protein
MVEKTRSFTAPRLARSYRPAWMRDAALREARTCYGHLAGRLGVAICDVLVARRLLRLDADAAALTPDGEQCLAQLGLDLAAVAGRGRPACRICVDWSERRPHLGGAVGAALAQRLLALGWLERRGAGRALLVTPLGRVGLHARFGIELPRAAA